MDGNTPVNRNDLTLLLKSYENSIILNSTLLEQQKQLVEKQNQLLEDFHNCTTTQSLRNNRSLCHTEHSDLKDTISLEHHGLTLRFLLMFGSIIGTLITVLVMLLLKFNQLDKLDLMLILLQQMNN